jgi:hypothetical protein
MVRTEHRLEAYATLFSGLSSDLSEPSWKLSPWTRVTTQRPKVAWLPSLCSVRDFVSHGTVVEDTLESGLSIPLAL